MEQLQFSIDELKSPENLVKLNYVCSALFMKVKWVLHPYDFSNEITSELYSAGNNSYLQYCLKLFYCDSLNQRKETESYLKLFINFVNPDFIATRYNKAFIVGDDSQLHSFIYKGDEMTIPWNPVFLTYYKSLTIVCLILVNVNTIKCIANCNVSEIPEFSSADLKLLESTHAWSNVSSLTNITYKYVIPDERNAEVLSLEEKTSVFSINDGPNWRLTFYMNQDNNILTLIKPNNVDIFFVNMYCLNKKLQTISLNTFYPFNKGCNAFFSNDLWQNFKQPDGNLTIIVHIISLTKCRIVLKRGAIDVESEEPKYKKEFKDFEKLLFSSKYSDLKLLVDNQKIYVHKNILSSRSTRFKELIEEKSNIHILEITNFSADSIRALCRYIYTCQIIENDYKIITDLLSVASCYDVSGFKSKLQEILAQNITITNVVDLLLLAETHNAKILKESTMLFIRDNIKEIDNQYFCKVKISYPNLVYEILLAVSKQRATSTL